MNDNQSSDGPLDVLAPYIEEGIVEYIIWDRSYGVKEWWYVQKDAYIDAVERALNKSKWLCVIDTDEFIVPINDNDLRAFLRDFEPYGGICLNWVFYGSSGVQRVPEGEWMVTRLLHRAKLSYPGNRTVKSIFQPQRVNPRKCFFPHLCAYREPFYSVNPDKVRLKTVESIDPCIDRIRLHHYWSRDQDFLWQVKLPRNERWHGTQRALIMINEEKRMNDEYDPIILDVIQRLLK